MSIVMNQSRLWQDIVGIVIMKMTINKGLENAMQMTEIMSNISVDPIQSDLAKHRIII